MRRILYKLTLSNGAVIESRNLRSTIFDSIEEHTHNEFDAIEATSWAEIAGVGEIYEHGYFTLEIIDD